jgi:ubiquinone/menaquinone biosynthesis C-methylase UbiE
VLGTGDPKLITRFLDAGAGKVEIIVPDQDALLSERIRLPKHQLVRMRFSDYSVTDFPDGEFDFIYSQGALSIPHKSKALKEMKRILSSKGRLLSGEFVYSSDNPPVSVKQVWENAGIVPLHESAILFSQTEAGFICAEKTDLSSTLSDLYHGILALMSNADPAVGEMGFEKKSRIRYKHEANMYLKMGGMKCTKYIVYNLKKSNAE